MAIANEEKARRAKERLKKFREKCKANGWGANGSRMQGKGLREIVMWVFYRLHLEECPKKGCPRGARAMWEEAKDDPKWFLRTMVAKLMPSGEEPNTMTKGNGKEREVVSTGVLDLLDQFKGWGDGDKSSVAGTDEAGSGIEATLATGHVFPEEGDASQQT